MIARRILLVEDQPMIAMMLEDFLDSFGRVASGVAATEDEAMDLVEAGGFDAAILDRNLAEGGTSDAVAERLAVLGIPFASSSGEGAGAGDDGPFAGRPVLPKPYTMSQFGRVLDALDLEREAA